MSDVTIYHNPRCSKSRQAVDVAKEKGADFAVVKYLDEPLSRDQVVDLLAILEDDAPALVRRDANFKDLGLSAADVETVDQVADVLAKHPKLMERPVLVRGGKAIIGRPTDRVEPFVS